MDSIIAIVVLAIVFDILWSKGVLAKFAQFSGETKQELLKCSWPGWDELKGSTIVVLVATLCIAVFTLSSDSLVKLVLEGLLNLVN